MSTTAWTPAPSAPASDAAPDAPVAAKVRQWRDARSDHQVVRDSRRAALEAHRSNLALLLALGRLEDRMAERAADLDAETAAALMESGPYTPPGDCWRYHGAVGSDGLLIVVGDLLDFAADPADGPRPAVAEASVAVYEDDGEIN